MITTLAVSGTAGAAATTSGLAALGGSMNAGLSVAEGIAATTSIGTAFTEKQEALDKSNTD